METAHHDSIESGQERKKKLWRNLFLLNLCVTLLLIGLFWLPLKMIEVNKFLDSPSVDLPQKGELAGVMANAPAPAPAMTQNLIAPRDAVINASSEKEWVYFSFAAGATAPIQDTTSREWDLAFRRGKVITNGGATNKFGEAGVIDLGEVDFDTLAEAPAENYVLDTRPRSETENKALSSWYKYNYITHKLSPRKNVYAVRTAKGKYAKVQFTGFYCDNKETGCIRMRYAYQDNGGPSFAKTGLSSATPAVAPASGAADAAPAAG